MCYEIKLKKINKKKKRICLLPVNIKNLKKKLIPFSKDMLQ